jgi:hypothetical protein
MRRTKTKGPPWTCSASFSARLSVAPWLRSSPQSCCSPLASANAGDPRRPPPPGRGGLRGRTRPQHHVLGPPPPCDPRAASRGPPSGARGSSWASWPTDSTRAAESRPRPPPPPPEDRRRAQSLAPPPPAPPPAPPWPRAPVLAPWLPPLVVPPHPRAPPQAAPAPPPPQRQPPRAAPPLRPPPRPASP